MSRTDQNHTYASYSGRAGYLAKMPIVDRSGWQTAHALRSISVRRFENIRAHENFPARATAALEAAKLIIVTIHCDSGWRLRIKDPQSEMFHLQPFHQDLPIETVTARIRDIGQGAVETAEGRCQSRADYP